MSLSQGNIEDSIFLSCQPEAYPYTAYQIQELEKYFLKFQHASDIVCRQIAEEIELTERQVMFWFLNKTNIIKHTTFPDGVSGTRLSFPNNAIRMQQPPLVESARNMITGNDNNTSEAQPNYHHFNSSHIVGSSTTTRAIDQTNLIQIILSAKKELVKLLEKEEPLWIEDTDGRYVIHRKNYENFTKEFRLEGGSSSCNRFESSKHMGLISINAKSLITMLTDSNVRLDMLPTILTESVVLKEYNIQGISSDQFGPIQLVYEQMHMLSPLMAPRNFYYLRYWEKIGAKTWVIVEVSCDPVSYENMHLPSHFSSAWRLPSGCLIKEVMPTLTQVIWVEHVQVNDSMAVPPQAYKDIVFRGLLFDAHRILRTLIRSVFRENCHIMLNKVGISQHFGLVPSMSPKARKVVVDISHRMCKNFCGNLSMQNKIELPYLSNNDIRFSLCMRKDARGNNCGFLINAATSMWIPLPFQEVVDFINDANMRSKWDILFNGQHGSHIATITYGKSQENSISLIKPQVLPSISNLMVIQETLSDPLGAVVLYAPIEANSLQKAIDEAISPGLQSQPCDIELIPSGFIIYKDGSPGMRSGSSIYDEGNKGSLVTAAFQIRSPEITSFGTIDMNNVRNLHSHVTTTIQSIKNALNVADE